jgi:hypothetical protein
MRLMYLNGTARHAVPSATHTALLGGSAAVPELLVSVCPGSPEHVREASLLPTNAHTAHSPALVVMNVTIALIKEQNGTRM